MASDSVRVSIPATTANLGPGFDCLGMALGFHNHVELAIAEQTTVEITGFGAETLARDERNLVLRAAQRVAARRRKRVRGWTLKQENNIHLVRGMGSSSAAIVGGLVAANELLDCGLSPRELLDIAVDMEGHPDNVAPALLGGLTVCCTDDEGLGVARFDPPECLVACLAIPAYEVSTESARKVMPQTISHADGVFNTCHAASVLAAFISGDMALLGQAMKDRLHEPYRAPLVRGLDACAAAAREAGAYAVALSGSGPTIVAFAGDRAWPVMDAMLISLRAEGVECEGRLAQPAREGATLSTV